MLGQLMAEVTGSEGFSPATGHLDEGARPALSKRFFEPRYRASLGRPEAAGDQRWKTFQAGTKRGTGSAALLDQPLGQRFRSMKCEHCAAAGFGFEEVGKPGFRTCALIAEWQGPSVGFQRFGKSFAVLGRLNLISDERKTLFLRFDHAGGLLQVPLHKRREILHHLALRGAGDPIRLSPTFDTKASDLVAAAKEQRIEGFIAKLVDNVYEPGRRSDAWVKFKVNQGQELVISGYIPVPHTDVLGTSPPLAPCGRGARG